MNQLSNISNELLSTATQAALEAGELVLKKWRQPLHITEKGFRDLVTDADHASQALITTIIRARFPDHGFLVEEEAKNLPPAGPIIWVIDPIDGTTNYSRHIPNYCISIAAVKQASTPGTETEILAGVIYDPVQNELFQADAGHGAALNGEKIEVSATDDIARSIFCVDWSHDPVQRQTTLNIINNIAPKIQTLRAIGSAALALAYVAAGRVEGYVNLNLKPWDVAAGKLLITEAGGKIVTVDGRPWQLDTNGFIAGNGRVSPDLIVKVTVAQ